jgi:hypothetical protein
VAYDAEPDPALFATASLMAVKDTPPNPVGVMGVTTPAARRPGYVRASVTRGARVRANRAYYIELELPVAAFPILPVMVQVTYRRLSR